MCQKRKRIRNGARNIHQAPAPAPARSSGVPSSRDRTEGTQEKDEEQAEHQPDPGSKTGGSTAVLAVNHCGVTMGTPKSRIISRM